MAMNNALVFADVMHARQRPRKHKFNYGVSYLYLDLNCLGSMESKFLFLNRWNLFSFYEKDHGPRNGASLDPWIRQILAANNLTGADGAIRLLTLPRLLGHVFNPVSFWFCFDKAGELRAVLSEVSNTFGEHHCYLSYHDNHRAIKPNDWLRSEKVFHVSPFMNVEGYYRFRFMCQNDAINVSINYYDKDGLVLTTGVAGTAVPLTPLNLLKSFIRYPLVTFKVTGLIHLEAARLLLKRVRYRPKPPPPTVEITR